MATSEKVWKSLKSAMMHLENSMQALNRKDDDSFAESLWHLAAELEYMLFLFSITFQDESDVLKWKPNPEIKKIENSLLLGTVQNLLNDVEKFVVNEKLLDAYKSAHTARNYILKVQEDIAKKKHEVLKGK